MVSDTRRSAADRPRGRRLDARVLVAPDKFKGSLTAAQVAEALAAGLREERPGVEVRVLPLADGGDGSVAAALGAGYRSVDVPVTGPTQPVADYDRQAWNAVLSVNLTGTFTVTQQAIPLLKESPRASIVVMSSIAGRFGYPNRVAYSTTKWGLVGFTKTLSLELGPHGITANAIHPGAVQGPRIEQVIAGRAEVSGRTAEEETQLALANQAVNHFVDPADIAALAVFLAGPHGRSISGQSFPIDGDSKAAQ